MAEYSQPWDGTDIGDALARAPYADDEWDDMYEDMLGSITNIGILLGVGGELIVSGIASPLDIAAGAAFVKGKFYKNTAATTIVVPNPAAAVRIDNIVLRTTWAAKTIRLTRVAGVEGGGAPALVQVDGTTWDLPLAEASITVPGVITVTDTREELVPRGIATMRQGAAGLGPGQTWATSGTTDYRTGEHMVQAGRALWTGGAAIGGQTTVTFPVPFVGGAPVVLLTPANYVGLFDVTVAVMTTNAANFIAMWRSRDGVTTYTNMEWNWFAIGPI